MKAIIRWTTSPGTKELAGDFLTLLGIIALLVVLILVSGWSEN